MERKLTHSGPFMESTSKHSIYTRGDVNTYAIFAETNRMLISEAGRVGCIVPSGIAFADTTKFGSPGE